MLHVEGQVESVTFNLEPGNVSTAIRCFGSDYLFVAAPALIGELKPGTVIGLDVGPRAEGEFTVYRCVVENDVVYGSALLVAEAKQIICTSDSSSVSFRNALEEIRNIEVELIAYLKQHPERMRELHSDTFEKLIAEILASHGFETEWTGRNKDTAGDVLAVRRTTPTGLNESYVVECKRNSESNSVGVDVARTLYGAVIDEQRSGGILVTTSRFESGVYRFANSKWNLHVKDYQSLCDWLEQYLPRYDGLLYMGTPPTGT